MQRMLAALTLAACLQVQATENQHDRSHGSPANANSRSSSWSGSAAVSESKSDASATGGSATSNAEVGGVRAGDNAVTINEKHRKPVPSVYIGSPDTTAPCWIGLSAGGSGSGFGVSGLFARRDKACLAMLQFHNLAKLGLFIPAATAYCTERANLWKPFGDLDRCEAMLTQSLIDASIDGRRHTDSPLKTGDSEASMQKSADVDVTAPEAPPDFEAMYMVASAETQSAVARAEAAERVARRAVVEAQKASKTAEAASQGAEATSSRIEQEYRQQIKAVQAQHARYYDDFRERFEPIQNELCEGVKCE